MGWSLPKSLRRWGRLTLQALGLAPSRTGDAFREGLALGFLAWFPIAAVSAVQGFAAGGFGPFFRDFSVHVRFLVAIPLMHMGSTVLVMVCKESLHRLVEEKAGPEPPLETISAQVDRWRESRARAVLLLAVCFLLGQSLYWGLVTRPVLEGEEGFSAVGFHRFWLTWVALPAFYLVGLRAILLWLSWCRALLRVGRLPLRLSSAHPDYVGGLEFMVRPSLAFCLVIAGLFSILGSAWGAEIAYKGASLRQFEKLITVWAVVCLLVTLGPLVFLYPRLLATRIQGMRDFGKLATSYTQQFEDRWIRQVPDRPLLGAQDLQSLADLGGSFQVVREMRLVPFRIRHALVVLLAALGPVSPLVLTQIPLREILLRLLETMAR